MLKLAANAYAVNPNPDLEVIARQNGWKIYWPEMMRNMVKSNSSTN
jgi:phosphoserine phosphatase